MDSADSQLDAQYYDITANIDAREVLRYLNKLGIYNISGEVLKYFITDLKKYIRYDLKSKFEDKTLEIKSEGPERLHSISTFSSRNRSKRDNVITSKCPRDSRKVDKKVHISHFHSLPNLPLHQNISEKNFKEEKFRRQCSCSQSARKSEATSSIPSISKNSENLIKVRKQPTIKKCDPVALYHFYTSLWEKYKNNVPGENDWARLRWSVRQKMAGNTTTDSAHSKLIPNKLCLKTPSE